MLEKKEWHDPKLIVLVRSKPEETVLAVCKGAGFGYGFPASAAENHLNCSLAGCDGPCSAQSAS